MSVHKKLYLSVVSSEFGACRELLTKDLKLSRFDVAVREDFVAGGGTLEKLDEYIRTCDGVVHLIGKATGFRPEVAAVAAWLKRYPAFPFTLPSLSPLLDEGPPGFSYMQWGAYMALYHDRPLLVYRAADFELDSLSVPRSPRFVPNANEVLAQKVHYQRLLALGRYHDGGHFRNEEHLRSAVLRDLIEMKSRLEDISVTALHELPSAFVRNPNPVPPLPTPQIVRTEGTHPILFLCYRREDTSDAAGRLHDRLVDTYGADGVFMDIDSVPLGTDFVDHVSEQISKCRAVIVMIGKQWIKVKDKRRRRRLDNEDDLVRAEIAAALQQKVPVIPVLVQDAAMPSADELPENIRLLARRNGISLSASRWRTDVERLIKELDPVMKR